MVDTVRPDWLTELIEIVKLLCPAPGVGSTAGGSGKKIGPAWPDPEHGPGWFWVGLAGQIVDSDQLDNGALASADGPEQHRFQLIESMQDGNILKVRVAEHAPAHGQFLWISARPSGLLEKSLLDGLSSIERFDLVSQFADGRPDPVPAEPQSRQDSARKACQSPGIHLVWGPPGTGKTTVIVTALQDIIASGKSALLVSGTNIAVDNAVARAAAALQPRPGVIVRAGTPHLPEVAENRAVSLQKLIQERQQRLELQRRELHKQISSLRRDPVITLLAQAEAELAGFDQAAWQQAADRLRAAELAAAWASELAQLRQRTQQLTALAETSRERAEQLQSRSAQAESARQDLAVAAGLGGQLNELTARRRGAREQVARLTRERDRLAAELAAPRNRVLFGSWRDKGRLRSVRRQLAATTAEFATLELNSQVPAREWAAQIQLRRERAKPHTHEVLAALADQLSQANDDAIRCRAALAAQHERMTWLEAELSQAGSQPDLIAGDRALVARAQALDLPGKLARLPRLRQQAAHVVALISQLEERHEQIIATMGKESVQIRRELVERAQVVAATLALLRVSSALHERDYDYVIVDEVAFACVPEVLYAASRARIGVTLLGDFLQNWPIPPDRFRPDPQSPQPESVRRWYQQDSFAMFGIRDPLSAQANPGCVALTAQYRFGPAVTRLANDVAYGGVLQLARPGQDGGEGHDEADVRQQADEGQQEEHEVVLIDVDGLGDTLAAARRHPKGGRWWPAGALIAVTLAAAKLSQEDITAGIVVPYRAQQELVQSLLAESAADPRIEVGTSHRFQGREFDTVIFDLVEDGSRRGWVASGTLNADPWQAGGLRMFNVGITRAKRRLYLIANGAAIERAQAGPLRAIRALRQAGQIRTVRARDILGLPEPAPQDRVSTDILQALHGYATLIDLPDADQLPDELCRMIDAARYRIWLWTPWPGKRQEQLLPYLLRARDRGVAIHPVVLAESEPDMAPQSRHEKLAALFQETLYFGTAHQTLIVIDYHFTFAGSRNVLAPMPGTRPEVLTLFRSKTLTERILDQERIDELAHPPCCPRCRAPVRDIRGYQRRLTWLCECGWTRPFSDSRTDRYRPRR